MTYRIFIDKSNFGKGMSFHLSVYRVLGRNRCAIDTMDALGGLGSEVANTHVLDVKVVFDSVPGPFAAKARLLDPSKRGVLSGNHCHVHAHHSVLQGDRKSVG